LTLTSANCQRIARPARHRGAYLPKGRRGAEARPVAGAARKWRRWRRGHSGSIRRHGERSVQAGDVILDVNGRAVSSPADVRKRSPTPERRQRSVLMRVKSEPGNSLRCGHDRQREPWGTPLPPILLGARQPVGTGFGPFPNLKKQDRDRIIARRDQWWRAAGSPLPPFRGLGGDRCQLYRCKLLWSDAAAAIRCVRRLLVRSMRLLIIEYDRDAATISSKLSQVGHVADRCG